MSNILGIEGPAGWTAWAHSDRPLYEQRFSASEESGSYERNFGYVQQECRHQAWKFVEDDLLVTACSRSEESEFIFLLPPVGTASRAARRLPGLCRALSGRFGRRIVLRKLSLDLLAALRSDPAFICVPLETYRNPRELPEDIHPQVVAPTRTLDGFTGSAFVKVRNNMRNAHRAHEISFCNLGAGNRYEAIAMIRAWARAHDLRVSQSSIAGKAPADELGIDAAAYFVFCERMAELVDDHLYFGRVMLLDGEANALTFAGRTARDTAGLYASICLSRTRGTSECMIADILDLLARKGISLLNFGGSEGLSMFRAKKKWRPSALVETHELEFIA